MKNFLIIFFSSACLCLSSVYCSAQQEKNFIIDQSGILDTAQRKKLNDLFINHEKNTTNQIVLLTTDSFYPDSTIETYTFEKFDSMGIGRKDIDNGVLIVFSLPLRKVRIETGLGTAKVLTDSIAKNIIDLIMIPQFKQQKYFEGLWDASLAITTFLEKPENKIK